MAEEIREGKQFEPALSEPFVEGFNLRTLIAALFIGFIMIPGTIYLGLITGGCLGNAAQWVTVILLVEIAKRSFVNMKKQEIYIIYSVAGSLMVGGFVAGTFGSLLGGPFGNLIWNQYFVQSPYAVSFDIARHIPAWAVPPAGSAALAERSFFHRDWLVPIILIVVTAILYRITMFTLGYALFRITSDVEGLPFPMAPVGSEGATALAESGEKKETWRWRIFSISAMIGVIYGAFYIVIPTVTGLLMSQPFQLIPIPWVDFTDKLGTVFPGALLGFSTDLGALITGFVLPFWVVVGSFVGSVIGLTIGNPILYKAGILKSWQPGMTAIPTNIVGTLDFWINALIGGGIVVGLLGIWKLLTAFSKRSSPTGRREIPKDRGDYPIPLAIAGWVLCTILYIIICHLLVPGFPLFLFILFGFVLTPFLSYTTARMFGITGVPTGASFPMVREASFILSGYKGAGIWFAPIPYFDFGATAQGFKQLELTRTKFTSWYKSEFTALSIVLFCSFLFWSIIWRMAPIPSSTYPFVQKIWPMNALLQSLWVTSTLPDQGIPWMLKAMKLQYILSSVSVGFVLYGLIAVFKAPIAMFYGLIGGVGILPHYVLPMFAGALLSRFYFSKKIGKENWARYTPIILAGYACGTGLIGMISVAVALIAKTVFQLVF